jgi:hypothetical protein
MERRAAQGDPAQVLIAIIDLLKLSRDSVLDAAALMTAMHNHMPHYHRYELLVYQGVPDQAVVLFAPATRFHENVDLSQGLARIPRAITRIARGRTEEAILQWIATQILEKTGMWDRQMAVRVLQGMLAWTKFDDLA